MYHNCYFAKPRLQAEKGEALVQAERLTWSSCSTSQNFSSNRAQLDSWKSSWPGHQSTTASGDSQVVPAMQGRAGVGTSSQLVVEGHNKREERVGHLRCDQTGGQDMKGQSCEPMAAKKVDILGGGHWAHRPTSGRFLRHDLASSSGSHEIPCPECTSGMAQYCHLCDANNPILQQFWPMARYYKKLAEVLEEQRLESNRTSPSSSKLHIRFARQGANAHQPSTSINQRECSLLTPGCKWHMRVDLDQQLKSPPTSL